jgi:hypothetical protein
LNELDELSPHIVFFVYFVALWLSTGAWGAMTFEIQWTGHQGAAMTHRDTPVEAIRFAIEMLYKDFTDVVIVDLAEGGKTYTPAEFARLYKDAKR